MKAYRITQNVYWVDVMESIKNLVEDHEIIIRALKLLEFHK